MSTGADMAGQDAITKQFTPEPTRETWGLGEAAQAQQDAYMAMMEQAK
jgi:hypothetical protein